MLHEGPNRWDFTCLWSPSKHMNPLILNNKQVVYINVLVKDLTRRDSPGFSQLLPLPWDRSNLCEEVLYHPRTARLPWMNVQSTNARIQEVSNLEIQKLHKKRWMRLCRTSTGQRRILLPSLQYAEIFFLIIFIQCFGPALASAAVK